MTVRPIDVLSHKLKTDSAFREKVPGLRYKRRIRYDYVIFFTELSLLHIVL